MLTRYSYAGGFPSSPCEKIKIKNSITITQLQIAAFLLDVLALLLAYKIAAPMAGLLIEIFQEIPVDDIFYQVAHRRLIACFALSMGVLFTFFINGHYTKRIPWWSQVQLIVKVMLCAFLVDGFTAYILDLHYSRLLILANWSLAFAFLLLARVVLNTVKIRTSSWYRPVAIIGDIPTVTDMLYAMDADRGMGFAPKMVLLRDKNADQFDCEELPERYRHIRIENGASDYGDFIQRHKDHYFIVSLEAFRGEKRERLLDQLKTNGISFAVVPSISRVSLYQSEPIYFFGNDIVMLGAKSSSVSVASMSLKRVMDICGATLGLFVLAIPMLVVAAMLRIEGQGGSIFYAGPRIGQGGRQFRCWKFRSMEPGTDHLLHKYLEENPEAQAYWDRYLKLPNDPRVQTRTAKFIRKASIDEIPQLWNVLKGEMSLVGPRPILPNEIETYGEDKYRDYTSVKPGVTGLWQVSGRNGTSFKRRVIWDSWYIHNRSLWGDIVIILKTIFVVLNRSGAH